jgi:hypothetical protein
VGGSRKGAKEAKEHKILRGKRRSFKEAEKWRMIEKILIDRHLKILSNTFIPASLFLKILSINLMPLCLSFAPLRENHNTPLVDGSCIR